VAQFWSFAADIYTEEREPFPSIAIGASAGRPAAWIADAVVTADSRDTYSLLLAAAAILVVSILLTGWADRRGPIGEGVPEAPKKADQAAARRAGPFRLASATATSWPLPWHDPDLNWVNTNGENLLFGSVQKVLQEKVQAQGLTDPKAVEKFIADGTTAFYGNFFFLVNVSGLLLQSFVASRLLKYGGFGALLMALPLISLLSYSTRPRPVSASYR
jgi:AAA family ATP:ADP antiporter